MKVRFYEGVVQFNSIQKIICIALPYRISITGGPKFMLNEGEVD